MIKLSGFGGEGGVVWTGALQLSTGKGKAVTSTVSSTASSSFISSLTATQQNHCGNAANRACMALMPRSPKPISLESRLSPVITRAAQEIAEAVREDFAVQMAAIVGGSGATSTRLGRSPKVASVPLAEPAKARRGRGRGVDAATLEKVTSFIAANPGKRSEEIAKSLGLDAKKALAKLRADGAVKTQGQKRAMIYFVGTASSPSATKAAAKAAASPAATPKRRGRPPKSAPIAAVVPSKATKKKRAWPSCSHADCKKKMFPGSGPARLCYEHFVASGGKHPKKK